VIGMVDRFAQFAAMGFGDFDFPGHGKRGLNQLRHGQTPGLQGGRWALGVRICPGVGPRDRLYVWARRSSAAPAHLLPISPRALAVKGGAELCLPVT
jgi:hypothetical protein